MRKCATKVKTIRNALCGALCFGYLSFRRSYGAIYLSLISITLMTGLNIAHASTCSTTLTNKVGAYIVGTVTLSTNDPNEDGETEWLYLSSSDGVLNTTVADYSVPQPFVFKASTADETISGNIAGWDADESCVITAKADPAQALTSAQKKLAADVTGGDVVAAGGTRIAAQLLCDEVSDDLCILLSGQISNALTTGALSNYLMSGDPVDPAYTVIATPKIKVIPPPAYDGTITPEELSASYALINNQAQIFGTSDAAYISGNRAEAAHEAGDHTWEIRQIQAAQLYALELGPLYNKQISLLKNLRQVLADAGLSVYVSPWQVYNFESGLGYGSWVPTWLSNGLAGFGLDTPQIQIAKQLLFVQNINEVAGTFPDDLIKPELISALQGAAVAYSGTPIDIRPGDANNAINPSSKGVIPVAILGTQTLKVSTINPATIRFGPNGVLSKTKAVIVDVNHDGKPDLLMHFPTQEAGIACGNTMAVLTAHMYSGEMISGGDTIRTVGCK